MLTNIIVSNKINKYKCISGFEIIVKFTCNSFMKIFNHSLKSNTKMTLSIHLRVSLFKVIKYLVMIQLLKEVVSADKIFDKN